MIDENQKPYPAFK